MPLKMKKRCFVALTAAALAGAADARGDVYPVSNSRNESTVAHLIEPMVSNTDSHSNSYNGYLYNGVWNDSGQSLVDGQYNDRVYAKTLQGSVTLPVSNITNITYGSLGASAAWEWKGSGEESTPNAGDSANATGQTNFNFEFTVSSPTWVNFYATVSAGGNLSGGAFSAEAQISLTGPSIGTELDQYASSASSTDAVPDAGGITIPEQVNETVLLYPYDAYTVTADATAFAAAFNNVAVATAAWNLNVSSGTTTVGTFNASGGNNTAVNWSDTTQWAGGTVPNGACQIAYLGSTVAPTVISLDQDITVGTLTIDSNASYTINGPGSLTIYCPQDGGHLNVFSGNHFINAEVNLGSDTTADIESGSLTLAQLQPASVNLTKTGAGLLAANNLRVGSVLISDGTIQILNQFGLRNESASVSVLSSLSFSGTTDSWVGVLDLGANDLIVHNGDLAALTNQVKQGYGDGSWQGSGGILSSSAANDSTHLTALGVIQNSFVALQGDALKQDAQGIPGLYTSFDGQSVQPSDVLIKYTYFGDANLDGIVDGSDYSLIDFGVLQQAEDPNAPIGWYEGDFNYDGIINGSDYTLIDNAFNTQGASLAAEQYAFSTTEIAGAPPVPEPSLVGALLLAGLFYRHGRGRHKRSST